MIASIRGTVTYITPQLRKDSYVVIEAAGVGYKISTPAKIIPQFSLGEEAYVFIYMAVSENAMDLYGFLRPEDKTFFVLLLTVPGIGPKSALAVLEKANMADVQDAVLENDPSRLVASSGLGQKTAEKIITALKDKVESLTATRDASDDKPASRHGDALAALLSFGYTAAEARTALESISDASLTTSERVRQALKLLSTAARA